MAKKDAGLDNKDKKSEKEAKAKEQKETKKHSILSPAVIVKEKFGSKENLIKEVKKFFDSNDFFIDKLNKEKGLERVSNRKLLRLYDMAGKIKEKFGSRQKLIEEYAKLSGRENDTNFKDKLSRFTTGRLLDFYNQAIRKARKSSAKTASTKSA